jgi:hypothetical protein
MAAIALVSAVTSFGVVRAWYPAIHRGPDATARAAQDIDLPPEFERGAASGRLSIVTDPAGARVEVDGQPRGMSPVVIDGLAAAEHSITVVSDGGVERRAIAVSNGVMTEVVFALPRSEAPLAGWMAVASPLALEVVEHDEVVGRSGPAKIMLAAGKHDVRLRNEEAGFEATRTITVAPGRVTSLTIDPPKAPLSVNARPWAEVLVDGETVGQTPLSNLSLTVGPHQITYRHPQLGERTERIVVTAHGVNRASVDLNK